MGARSPELEGIISAASHEHTEAEAGDASGYRAGAVDPGTLDLRALLPALTGDVGARWNFDAAVGGRPFTAGLGNPVTLNYVFLDAPEAYQAPYQGEMSHFAGTFQGLDAQQRDIVRVALAEWASFANITFVEATDVSASPKTITFGSYDIVEAGVLGYAYYPSYDFIMAEDTVTVGQVFLVGPHTGDVFFDSKYIDQAPDAGISFLATHEIGHAIGLSHTFDQYWKFDVAAQNTSYSVMAYATPTNATWWVPAAGSNGESAVPISLASGPALMDVLALQTLYGVNWQHEADNTTYSFDADQPVWDVLWDGGGRDTIDLSNFTLANRLDLNGGTFSDIGIRLTEAEMRLGLDPSISWLDTSHITYDGQGNFAIAHHAIIENARGGANTDILIGNGARNRLEGNDGNDVLEGGAGADLLFGGTGADIINGGSGGGADLAVFDGRANQYEITWSGPGLISAASTGTGQADLLADIEVLVFEDGIRLAYRDGFFNERFYLDENPDVANAVAGGGMPSAWFHYLNFGQAEGRNPTALFSDAYYLDHNQDVASAVAGGLTRSAFQHYMEFGHREGRAASAYFDTAWYLASNPDVAAAGVNPLEHFLVYGQHEDRQPLTVHDWTWWA